MKKTYVLIIIALLGMMVGIYYKMSNKIGRIIPAQQQNERKTDREILTSPIPFGKLTREDIATQDWSIQGGDDPEAFFGTDSWGKNSAIGALAILLRKIHPSKDWQDAYLLGTNADLSKTYFAFVERGSNHDVFVYTCIYSIDSVGNGHEVVCISNVIEEFSYFRFSPERRTMSFIARVEAKGNTVRLSSDEEGILRTEDRLVIIDMLTDTVSIISLPGDVKNFIASQKTSFENPSAIHNFVAAYRFPSSKTIEFTRYYIEDFADRLVGTQISDKELWSYNRQTHKLTLLETIPFKAK